MTVACLPTEFASRVPIDPPPGVDIVFWDAAGTPPENIAATEFWVPPYMNDDPAWRESAFALMPNLRVVQLLTAGVEPWLPVIPDGVTLCGGRGVHGISTAELALAGLLALIRELPLFLDQQRRGEWIRADIETLAGKRVLILGSGDIGTRIASAVRLFDAAVTLVARTARDGVHAMDELPALLPAHDVIAIALPHTPETHGLVDAAFLAAMPDGAILVNVARGAIVATDALVAELQSRRLRAFLDVTDPEPLPAGHPLWSVPNLLLTPHVGGGVPGWIDRAYRLLCDQLQRFVQGEPLLNVVVHGY